jgi:hypothetical protein
VAVEAVGHFSGEGSLASARWTHDVEANAPSNIKQG